MHIANVIAAFKPEIWYHTENDNIKSRIQFEGKEIKNSEYISIDLSDYFHRDQNPVIYIGNYFHQRQSNYSH